MRRSPTAAKSPRREKASQEEKKAFEGNVYIQATFNNTIVTITDLMGNAISWASAGALGFKGAKKSTPFAAQTTAESAGPKALEQGLREVDVFVEGAGRRQRSGHPGLRRAGHPGELHQGRHPDPA